VLSPLEEEKIAPAAATLFSSFRLDYFRHRPIERRRKVDFSAKQRGGYESLTKHAP
jgi:hypothetical protein